MRRMNSVEQCYAEAFACAERGKSLEREPNGVLQAVEQFETAIRILGRLAIVESAAKRELVLDAIRGLRERVDKIEATSDYALARAMREHEHARALEDAEALAQSQVRDAADTDAIATEPAPSAVETYLSAGDWYMKAYAALPADDASAKAAVKDQIEYVIEHVSRLKQAKAEAGAVVSAPIQHDSYQATAAPAAAVRTQTHALSSSDAFLQTRMSFSSLEWPEPPPDDLDAALFADMEDLSLAPSPSPHPTPIPAPAPVAPVQTGKTGKTGAAYTPEELDVLRRSSHINGHVFVPWLDDLDTLERFDNDDSAASSPLALFTDPDGDVPLAAKQRRKGAVWMRPSAFAASCGAAPVMIASISPQVVKQDIVTDCSFVASLCIAAAYEQRFRKPLITNIVYPVDAATQQPVYNPRGKYLVKLWANGVPRKVVIDDLLPVSATTGALLASCTTRPNELWVSLIEKAYLKLNGGYDFPGGNSGIDLFALTGWIPERIALADVAAHAAAKEERLWRQLQSAFHFGDCIITMSTGDLARDEAKRIGLVPMHVYAVLNVYELAMAAPESSRDDGAQHSRVTKRLLQLKNPWRKLSWTGPFSKMDTAVWQSAVGDELRAYQSQFYASSGDPAASADDDGLFWIDFDSVKQYFESIYLNWNPALFPHRDVCHAHWPRELGPANDAITLGWNPQYALSFATPSLQTSPSSATVWVLLSRHVREVERDVDQATQQFLTLHVYDSARGERVFFSHRALWRGAYSNNPHTLVSLDVDLTADPPPSFTLVASQYEKFAPLDFTISVFATSPFTFTAIPQVLTDAASSAVIHSAWRERTAGGRPFFPTFMDNPQFHIQFTHVSSATSPPCRRVFVFLEEAALMNQDAASASAPVNVRAVLHTRSRVCGVPSASSSSVATTAPLVLSSGEYRPGFCLMEIAGEHLVNLQDLVLVPSTFEPLCESAFTLRVVSDPPHALAMTWREVAPEGHGMECTTLRDAWDLQTGSAAGCSNYGCYTFNPKFVVHVPRECELFVRLLVDRSSVGGASSPPPAINVSVFESTADGDLMLSTNPKMAFRGASSEGGVYAGGNPSGVATTVTHVPPGWYVVLPSTFEPHECAFELRVYTSVAADVRRV